MYTGQYLTVYNKNISEGEKIVQNTYQGLDSQKWVFRDSKVNGWILCSFTNPSLVVTINKDNKLILSKNQKTDMQMFYIFNITKEETKKDEGIYKIALGKDSSKAIGISSVTRENNALLDLSNYR